MLSLSQSKYVAAPRTSFQFSSFQPFARTIFFNTLTFAQDAFLGMCQKIEEEEDREKRFQQKNAYKSLGVRLTATNGDIPLSRKVSFFLLASLRKVLFFFIYAQRH